MEQKLDLILKKLEELNVIKQDIQDVKSQMNSRFDTLETKSSIVESKMEQGFEDVKDKLRTIEEQTAHVSEFQSPIHDFQQQLLEHDADIKLIKRVLTNQ